MEDAAIVHLYWQRNEDAIRETRKKYGDYLGKIAWNILANREDSEESINDTYLQAWNSMPPQKPEKLSAYLGRLTRQLSIDIYRRRNRAKRGGSEYALSLAELEDCVSGKSSPEETADANLLAEVMGQYLRGLSPEVRIVFLRRYYFMDSLREIAAGQGFTESKVKSLLYRTRQGLRAYLEKEGFSI